MARIKALTIIVLAVVALLGATRVAAANPVRDYRDVMKGFVPDIRAWSVQTSGLIEAAVAKPELACGEELQALARQGKHASEDMVGTARMAPRSLLAAHRQVARAMADLAAAGENACGNESVAAVRARQALRELNLGLAPIQQLLGAPEPAGAGIDIPGGQQD